jgi:hypothetical protein
MSNVRFWNPEIVRQIIASESIQLKDLAHIAGLELENVLKFGEIRGLDMRFQDLSGINLSGIDLSTSIIDGTTIIDDSRSVIGGTDTIINQYLDAITNSYNMADWRMTWRTFRSAFGKPTKFVFFVGDSRDITSIIRQGFDKNTSIPFISTSGGYYARRVAFVECAPNQSLYQAIISFFQIYCPTLLSELSSSEIASRQLELPLNDGPPKIRRRAPTSTNLNRVISSLRKSERISDICLIIDEPRERTSMRDLQKEIADFVRAGTRLRYLFLCNDDRLALSSWRRSLVKDKDTSLIESGNHAQVHSGHLRSITAAMSDHIRFTSPFTRNLNQAYSQWNDARKAVASAGIHAIEKARRLPISVGTADLRSALLH